MAPGAPHRVVRGAPRGGLGSAEADHGQAADVGDPRLDAEVAHRVEEVDQILRDVRLPRAPRDGLDGLVGHLASDAGDLLLELGIAQLLLAGEVVGVAVQALVEPAVQLVLLDVDELDGGGRQDLALLSFGTTGADGQPGHRVRVADVLDRHVAALVEGLGGAVEVGDVERDLAATVIVRHGDAVASAEGDLGHGDPFL